MKIGSLCTGYGGLDLAVEEHFAAETVWCAEFDKFASQVIEQRFGVPNFGDITKIDWHQVEPVDIITAGYPCQPFSQAGSRKGTNDHRHIWPHIAEAISIIRPKFVILENVRGHLSLGFDQVLADLTNIGYDAQWRIVRASDAGAPHRRERLFIVATPKSTYTDSIRFSLVGNTSRKNWNKRKPQSLISFLGKKIVTDPDGGGFEIQASGQQSSKQEFASDGDTWHIGQSRIPNPVADDKLNPKFVEYMMGLPDGWVTDAGLSRTQQLKMLGNGVVPQQAKLALELMT